MKNSLHFTALIVVFSLFSSCGSNKDLQEKAPAQFQTAYYMPTSEGIKLVIPVSAIQDQQISIDGVYFHGMKSKLVQDPENPNLFTANFRIGTSDMVMSEDPKDEYGNKPPQMPEKSPFDIKNDEAIVVFTQNNKTKYYKLAGIVEKE